MIAAASVAIASSGSRLPCSVIVRRIPIASHCGFGRGIPGQWGAAGGDGPQDPSGSGDVDRVGAKGKARAVHDSRKVSC